jgi:hypothetical protein
MAKGFVLDRNNLGEYFVSFKRDHNDLNSLIQGNRPATAITHEDVTRILENHGLSNFASTLDKEQVLAAVRELNSTAGINNK